jgi:hypothetical protein
MAADELSRMVGYELGSDQRRTILNEVATTGKDIRAVAAQYNMPEMAILNDNGTFEYDGKQITPEEWKKINPLGEYGKIVIIK